jgi:hypothetical protein
MFSIDQNSHSLWDALPKLHALLRKGAAVTHFIEDVDAAFTALGAGLDAGPLSLVRERFHRSGGADWGAALFYTEFLGRQPVEIRNWEPLVGMKTNVLAGKLGRSVDDLYDEFSPGDNWQLIGSSFVGDREHHRVVGDLTLAETAPFVRELLGKARQDTLRSFPARASRERANAWFDRETALVERLLGELSGGRLVDLYERWMREHLSHEGQSVRLDLTSRLFACDRADAPGLRLVRPFVADYAAAAGMYNDAITETNMPLRPLDTRAGELPLFAMMVRDGHFVRTGVFLAGGAVEIDGRPFKPGKDGVPAPADLVAAGVRCLAGKAMLLVSQVRTGPAGDALAVPHRGSAYMPAAHALARKLAAAGMIDGPPRPIVRVRLRLLDRLRELDTPIRLPAWLAEAVGEEEVPARRLGQAWQDLAIQARRRLDSFRDDEARRQWQQREMPDLHAEIAALNTRRRELAAKDPKDPELREIWKTVSGLQTTILDRTVRRIDADSRLADLDYYDTRGAALPWCVALGGESFYNEVVGRAEVYEEPSLADGDYSD